MSKLKELYKKQDLTEIVKLLPHTRNNKDPFVFFLMRSNILRMGKKLLDEPITLGADPEFILCDKKTREIVLFSSEFTGPGISLSQATVGADYGLMELRPNYSNDPETLINNVDQLQEYFSGRFTDLDIMRFEAIEFDHKNARLRQMMSENNDHIDYGYNGGIKDPDVWTGEDDSIVIGEETGRSLSAYDVPIFPVVNENLLTAGGHIHIGGSYVTMLSIWMIKDLVKILDKEIMPLCKSVETSAAELRRTAYGNIGEFRMKPYGLEYRSPSNSIFWPENRDTLRKILVKVKDIVLNFCITQTESNNPK